MMYRSPMLDNKDNQVGFLGWRQRFFENHFIFQVFIWCSWLASWLEIYMHWKLSWWYSCEWLQYCTKPAEFPPNWWSGSGSAVVISQLLGTLGPGKQSYNTKLEEEIPTFLWHALRSLAHFWHEIWILLNEEITFTLYLKSNSIMISRPRWGPAVVQSEEQRGSGKVEGGERGGSKILGHSAPTSDQVLKLCCRS